jgi:hypothetical protein
VASGSIVPRVAIASNWCPLTRAEADTIHMEAAGLFACWLGALFHPLPPKNLFILMTQGDDLETYQFPGESNDRIEASQPARSPPVAS